MSAYEFQIKVTGTQVSGLFGRPGTQLDKAGSADLVVDSLTRRTVLIMDGWLNFWGRIEDSAIQHKEALLKPETLEVLGTYLWSLILDNAVGEHLREHIPGKGMPPLRLLIEFDDSAPDALKGLPWEFLYEPTKHGFLSTRTELLLTRYVSPRERRAQVMQIDPGDQLRVLLIAALPRDNPAYGHPRATLGELGRSLKDVDNLDVLDPIASWDQEAMTEALSGGMPPVHIVHVVGICRGVPGHPQLYLGRSGDGFEDPAPLIEILTNQDPPPRLVILQLCDYKDGDATENFERLAPALIERDVPAVLALQYAAEADQVGLGKEFYRALVRGDNIGAAVQGSRHRLHGDRPDRRFGTPVLYLQEDGALTGGITDIKTTATAAAGGATGTTLGDFLLDTAITAKGLSDDQRTRLCNFVLGLGDAAEQPDVVSRQIKREMWNSRDEAEKAALTKLFLAVGQFKQEHPDARR